MQQAVIGAAGLTATPLIASTSSMKKLKTYKPTQQDILDLENTQAEYETILQQPIFKLSIKPHWFNNNNYFWYCNLLDGGEREFILVDAVNGIRKNAFNHQKMITALSSKLGKQITGKRLPFTEIDMADDLKTVSFHYDNNLWVYDMEKDHLDRKPLPPEPLAQDGSPQLKTPEINDKKWHAIIKDNNIYLQSTGDNKTQQITTDGTDQKPYGEISWAPDNSVFIAYCITPVKTKPVYMIESSPASGETRGILHQHEYDQPGDPLTTYEMHICNPATQSIFPVYINAFNLGEAPELRWNSDNSKFYVERTERGHQHFQILEVDATTGKSKAVIDETTNTFINTSNQYSYYTKGAAGILYISERDGWRHLYFYDTINGGPLKQITKGEWVVRSVTRVDEENRCVWFEASGLHKDEDPYLLHHCRVNFDGSDFIILTDGNGSHSVQYSPDNRFLIDSYSRVDCPPKHTLRNAGNGKLICHLETADISPLVNIGFKMPEVFCAKGRDGVTDIWGIVFRPLNLDPSHKYPIIEDIYAGPQDSFVRKTFSVNDSRQALANLGFIVVQCDGMGTRNRSKKFHDVCWHNIKDAGFPDRIAWIKALAKKYPYCDTSRVGIYGTSAGGQNAAGALLFHPEFYKVAVSSCGCHDNRIDKRWWNEQWMGYPVGDWYADNSNITHAANLRGKLLLMVGELDDNVPPESTLRLADALMKADKDFDLLVLTGQGHTGGGAYGDRRRRDFFIRHLLGVEPPDHNTCHRNLTPVQLQSRPVSDAYLAQASSGQSTTITFKNQTKQAVEIFWLPGDDNKKSYGAIDPGKTYEQHTYSGHWWMVCNNHGKELMIYVATNRPGIAIIK